MTDPLAQYRKKTTDVVAQPPPPKGPDEYMAFDAKDRVARLKIRRASEDDPTRSPGYHYLLDVVYSGPNVTHLVLIFTFLIVKVRGTNLQPIVTAVELGTADFIQEYDAEKWPKPKDPKAPLIESIQVVVKENGPAVSDTEKSGNEKAQGRNLH
jgi:hypothetical protein